MEDIEIPIKEWRDRYRRLCDVGTDVIIGHHPHVPQGYEKHGKSLIFYSLGNFYFDTPSFAGKSDDSYGVLLEFHKNQAAKFDVIYHKKVEEKTLLVTSADVDFDLIALCNLLGDGYHERHDNMILELFHRYYYWYYEIALGVIQKNSTLAGKIKSLIKQIISNRTNVDARNLMLLHNIRIDSHRFVVQRALSLISERES